MVKKSSTSLSPPPSYASSYPSEVLKVFSYGRRSSGADSVFTNRSVISKHEAKAAFVRHTSTSRKYSTNAAQQMNIKEIETHIVWHNCVETVIEHRWKSHQDKPYKENRQSSQINSGEDPPDIWSVPVDYHNCLQNRRIRIPNTTQVKKCVDCTGRGQTMCQKCSGARNTMCHTCHGCGQKEKHETCYKMNSSTNQQEMIREIKQITCYRCGGGGRVTCHTCGGNGTSSCRKCGGGGKVEVYSVLEVEWEKKRSNHYQGTQNLPEKIKKKLLPQSKGKCVYRKSGDGLIEPLTLEDCDDREILKCSNHFFRLHRRWASGENIRKQKQTLSPILVHEVLYDIKGNISTLWIVGDEKFVFAPNCPRSCKSNCSIM